MPEISIPELPEMPVDTGALPLVITIFAVAVVAWFAYLIYLGLKPKTAHDEAKSAVNAYMRSLVSFE